MEAPAHRMNTSRTIALASLVAFATQVVFALLMLRLFTPEEVGEFSVISQIGFFWMTLALAQSNLSLLANQHVPAPMAARQAWRASALRGLGLLPVAALAVWFSQLSLWPALLWALLLAFCQMTWMLAQSLTLRSGSSWQQSLVRVLPPATAAATALTAALLGSSLGWEGPVLLLAALLGYAVGAAWLVPAFCARIEKSNEIPPSLELTNNAQQSDPRSASLRMAHTLVDALLATAIIVVWQRLYGAEETGLMSTLLRVLAFVPSVVHMAWAQVALSHGANKRQAYLLSPGWLGMTAFACVSIMSLSCAIALHVGWLSPNWQGLYDYIMPLALWQGCACLSAAFSHRPFLSLSAGTYSWRCIALGALQMVVLLTPLVIEYPIDANHHITVFALVSSVGLLVMAYWMSRLRS
jgi:hypothetical protein